MSYIELPTKQSILNFAVCAMVTGGVITGSVIALGSHFGWYGMVVYGIPALLATSGAIYATFRILDGKD